MSKELTTEHRKNKDKPSGIIHEKAGVFALSNTVGTSQLEYMLENKEEVIDQNAGRYIQAILDYLDEKGKKDE